MSRKEQKIKEEDLHSALLEILAMIESEKIPIGALGLSEKGYKDIKEFYELNK